MPRPALPALAGLLALTLFLYWPGTAGPYLADDFPNLVDNPHLIVQPFDLEGLRAAAFSSGASPFYRPLSMLSFALGYTAAGSMDPFSAKFGNILLHLATGLLLYLFIAALLPRLRLPGGDTPAPATALPLAMLITGCWLLHPLFVSTVLYTVQRMTVLSAMFMLAGCLFYLYRRPDCRSFGDVLLLLIGSGLFTLLAFLCKENGALLPGLLLLIECAAFRFHFAPSARAARALLVFALALPTMGILCYLTLTAVEHWQHAARNHDFTIGERVLTQPRVLLQYGGWLSLVSPHPMGLYHDDFTLSRGMLRPPGTAVALLLWIGVTCFALWLLRRGSIVGLGLLWFLWGQVLESTSLPLALVFEHRNYLPGIGLLLAIIALLHAAMERTRLGPRARAALLAGVFLALPAWQLAERVTHWTDQRAFVLHGLLSKPDSALTLLSGAVFLASRGDTAAAAVALREARRANPREPAIVYAEAALHCQFSAGQPFAADLAGRLVRAARSSPRTFTARLQFAEMIKVCTQVPALADTMERVAGQRLEDRDPGVAMAARFGRDAVHAQRAAAAAGESQPAQ